MPTQLFIKKSTLQYPYSIADLRKEYPNKSFPANLENVDLSEYDISPVTVEAKPQYDPATHYLKPKLKKDAEGNWLHTWEVKVREEQTNIPMWESFNLQLMADENFLNYVRSANQYNPFLLIGIGDSYSKVAEQGIISSGFQTYWLIFYQFAQPSQEHKEAWATMAQSNNLPADFIALIQN